MINFIRENSFFILNIVLLINLLYFAFIVVKNTVNKEVRGKIVEKYLIFKNNCKIKLEIIRHQAINDILYLHRHNLLVTIWYLVIFLGILITCIYNWDKIGDIKFNPPSKYSILFVWLVILSLIPFGNGEILGFKFQSNGSLGNPNCEQIPKEDIENRDEKIREARDKIISGIKAEKESLNDNRNNNLGEKSEVKNVQ